MCSVLIRDGRHRKHNEHHIYAWACENDKTAPLIHAEHADFIVK